MKSMEVVTYEGSVSGHEVFSQRGGRAHTCKASWRATLATPQECTLDPSIVSTSSISSAFLESGITTNNVAKTNTKIPAFRRLIVLLEK